MLTKFGDQLLVDARQLGVVVPDRYVYGYGMDYDEQGRNLPGIYALRSEG